MTPNAAEKGPLVLRRPVKRKGRHALQTAGRGERLWAGPPSNICIKNTGSPNTTLQFGARRSDDTEASSTRLARFGRSDRRAQSSALSNTLPQAERGLEPRFGEADRDYPRRAPPSHGKAEMPTQNATQALRCRWSSHRPARDGQNFMSTLIFPLDAARSLATI
jgi:hypothetical protein